VLAVIGIGVGTVVPRVLAQAPAGKKREAPKDTWKPAGVLKHKHAVLCVAFGPDRILLASDEGPPAKGGELFRVWDAATRSEVDPQRGEAVKKEKEIPDDLRIVGITYAADNSLVSMRAKKAIHLMQGDSIQAGPLVGGGTGAPRTLATSADCKTHAIVGREKNTVMMYKYEVDFDKRRASSEDGAVCKGHEDEPRCAAFSPDGSLLVTGSADKTARIWDPTSGNENHVLRGHKDTILVVAFSPDGKSIATGGKDGLVKLWDANTGKEKASLKGHTVVRCLTFSPNGKTLVSGGEDQTVRIWDAKTGAAKTVLRNHKGTVLTVAFSRDGTLIASGGMDKTIRLWKKK
jgi:WD40 repeat protein